MKDFILLIPCYNNKEGLITSIKSIIYPYDRFEVLIVDDGSKTPLSLQQLQDIPDGVSFRIIRLETNQGILAALNTGLSELKQRNDYKYIARLDCGDTCDADRFTRQVDFLDNNPEIGLLGSWCKFINSNDRRSYLYRTKVDHKDILKEMHFKCSFIHPTVMFRKEVLNTVSSYPAGYPHAEDYAFFWEIMKHYRSAILSSALVHVDISDKGISSRNRTAQLRTRKKIIARYGSSFISKLKGMIYVTCLGWIPKRAVMELKFLWSYALK